MRRRRPSEAAAYASASVRAGGGAPALVEKSHSPVGWAGEVRSVREVYSRMSWSVTLLLAIQLVSVSDEIAIGRHAHAEVRRQTPQLADVAVNHYVARIGHQLAIHAPGARYPYSFSVAN